MKTGMTDLCWTQISPQYHVNRCNEMYGDGMNSFRNEIRPWYYVNSSEGMLRYSARVLIIPTMFISRVEKREKASSGRFLTADPVAATVTGRAVMLLHKSYPL